MQAAVAERDGEIEFSVNESSVWGTIHAEWADRNEKMGKASRRVKVPSIRFASLLEKYGVPHYIKIDIEGADMLCVDALKGMSSRPMFLSVESNKTSWHGLVSEFDAFRALGYTRFQIVNQATIPSQVEPATTREGARVAHVFEPGSSGLFGSDLPGPWLTRRQALRKYAAIFMQYKLFGDNTRGAKLARRLPWRVQKHLIPAWYDTHASDESAFARQVT